MKRDEIEVGKEYLVGTSPSWDDNHHRNERVVVLDTSHAWEKRESYLSRGPDHEYETDSGPVMVPFYIIARHERVGRMGKVLVRVITKGGEGRIFAYPAQHFRATWEEGQKIITERRERKHRDLEASAQREAERRQRTVDVISKAKTLGISASGFGGEARMTLDDFEALLDRLAVAEEGS